MAELAAAWRTLGRSDDEGLAVIASQLAADPSIERSALEQSIIEAAQSLNDPELRDSNGNLMPMAGPVGNDKYLNPYAVVEYGRDEADLQSLTVDEQLESRDTKQRKQARETIRSKILDSQRNTPTPQRNEFRDYYADGKDAITFENLYGYQDAVPQRVLERRIAPQDRLDTGTRQTRANGSGVSSEQKAYQDAYFRLADAFDNGTVERTDENLKLLDKLELQAFSKNSRNFEREQAKNTVIANRTPINSEVAARNAAKALTPQELMILERSTRGLERMGEIQIEKTGPGKDMVRELPRSTVSVSSMPNARYLYGPGGYTDAIGWADGDQMISGNWEPAVDSETNMPNTRTNGLGGLIYDNMYIDSEKNGYPQVGINQNVNLLQSRLQTKIPTKWGTLQNAPTTIRGIDDLDQALQAVIELAGLNKKALVEMPDAGQTGKPKVSKNPGGLEALQQLGYNRPEARSLFNAIAQLQMSANNQSEGASGSPSRTEVPINFDSPEQMGDFRVDNIVGPIDNSKVRGLMRGLTGNNIQVDFDDPAYPPERVLNMAQQNFSGEVKRTDPVTGEVRNSKPPIGGVSGNKNSMYNRTGIRDLGDLRYALEQQALRRQARLKRQPGDPVRRQVGKVTPNEERNIIRSLLATERANRDERKPKALPAAGQSLGSRDNAFLAEQSRREQVIESGREQSARLAIYTPSGRSPLGPGEWVRASDGNVRVMGSGGIDFDRNAAIAVNTGSRSMQMPDPWAEMPGTGQGFTNRGSRPMNSGAAALPYGVDTSGPSQGPKTSRSFAGRQAVKDTYGSQSAGQYAPFDMDDDPTVRPSPRRIRQEADYRQAVRNYGRVRKFGRNAAIAGGAALGVAGLDGLINGERNKREEVTYQ